MRHISGLKCVSLELFHHGCWTTRMTDVSEDFAAVPLFRKRTGNKGGSDTVVAISGRSTELKNVYTSVSRSENVRVTRYFCSQTSRGRRAEIWNVNIRMRNSAVRLFEKYRLPFYDATYLGEREKWLLAFDSRCADSVEELIYELGDTGEVNRVKAASPEEIILNRTTGLEQLVSGRKGLDLMRFLLECGFYEFPRKKSLSEMAGFLGVNKSTLSERIRKTERNILSAATGLIVPDKTW